MLLSIPFQVHTCKHEMCFENRLPANSFICLRQCLSVLLLSCHCSHQPVEIMNSKCCHLNLSYVYWGRGWRGCFFFFLNWTTVVHKSLSCRLCMHLHGILTNYKAHTAKKHKVTHTFFSSPSIKVVLITRLIRAPSVRNHFRGYTEHRQVNTLKHQSHYTVLLSNTHRASGAFHRGGKVKISKKLYLCF